MDSKLIIVQWINNVGGLEKISQDYENKFANYNPIVALLRFNENGLEYKNQHTFTKRNNILFVLDYFLFVFNKREAIFHLQYLSTFILLCTYLAGARKLIFHFHGTKFPNGFFDKIIWKYLEKRIKIIANSSHTENVIRKKLKVESEIIKIPNLINTNKFDYIGRTYDQGKFLVTFAGRFDKGKNIDVIIDAAHLLNNHNDIRFLLVGDGAEKLKILRKISELELNDKIEISPFTENISGIYKQSNLFLFLSSYESFGNVVAESILAGLPLLCYKLPALSELINDDSFFVHELSPKTISEKILDIKNNYSIYTNKLVHVKNSLIEYLDNDRIVNELDDVYRSLLNQ